jgi:hypothetical protein
MAQVNFPNYPKCPADIRSSEFAVSPQVGQAVLACPRSDSSSGPNSARAGRLHLLLLKRGILHLLWGGQSWLQPPFQTAFRAIYEYSWSERAG